METARRVDCTTKSGDTSSCDHKPIAVRRLNQRPRLNPGAFPLVLGIEHRHHHYVIRLTKMAPINRLFVILTCESLKPACLLLQLRAFTNPLR